MDRTALGTHVSSGVKLISAAPWERYLMADFSSNHSMTCHCRFWFEGAISRTLFSKGLAEVSKHHPFLSARYSNGVWLEHTFNESEQLEWASASSTINWTHLDRDDTLVRILVRTGSLGELGMSDQRSESKSGLLIVFKFHHAISDGNGVFALLRDLSEHINQIRVLTRNQVSLDYRIHFGLNWTDRWRRVCWDFKRISDFFVRRTVAYRDRSTFGELSEKPRIAFVEKNASKDWLTKVYEQNRSRGFQFNDLLIASLFRVLARGRSTGTIRIAVPISMRPKGNDAFCNLVSMVFLDRSISEIAKPELLDSVAVEMSVVKKRQLGHAMLGFLRIVVAMGDNLLSKFLSFEAIKVTAVLTNLGKPLAEDGLPFCIGDLRLIKLDSIAPIRPGTDLALSVNRFGEILSLNLRYNHVSLTSSEADNILTQLLLECEQLICAGSSAN